MKGKKIPMRQCIGCRESKEKKQLIRVVKVSGPEEDSGGEPKICIDRTGKINGRGAYLCDDLECLKKARKTNGLSRAFRINVSEEVYEDLERQLSE
ncbi:MAG: YlxR family protein [Eubacterium sp.]|nr:YlxR family protein [Eubacterium sp.]MCI9412097.1 YlxR family protein [Eubacterium sp.]